MRDFKTFDVFRLRRSAATLKGEKQAEDLAMDMIGSIGKMVGGLAGGGKGKEGGKEGGGGGGDALKGITDIAGGLIEKAKEKKKAKKAKKEEEKKKAQEAQQAQQAAQAQKMQDMVMMQGAGMGQQPAATPGASQMMNGLAGNFGAM